MKRNHTNRREPRSGISPYARHCKIEYRYSSELREWERSMGRKIKSDRERENAAS